MLQAYSINVMEGLRLHSEPWKCAGVDLHSKFRFELHNFLINWKRMFA